MHPMTRPNPTRPHRAGGRDECWSDGATDALIDAWGGSWVQLNRGNLRQKDWKEVADAVNARQNGVKPPKTEVQCKNRIDTLKKKYKVEKSKPLPSKWVFYHRLDSLIGASAVTNKKPTIVHLTVKSSNPKPRPAPIRGSTPVIYSSRSSRLGSGGASTERSLRDDDNDDLGFDGTLVRKQRFETVDFSYGAAFRELAGAILKFGEIYERIESSKQQQMMELEKQRLELAKDLEFQRMSMFMGTQLEVERMKRHKHGTTSGKKM